MSVRADYSKYETEAERRVAALDDTIEYLGLAKFVEVTDLLRIEGPEQTLRQWEMWCSFLGVSGYPVRAWYQHVWGHGKYPLDLTNPRPTMSAADVERIVGEHGGTIRSGINWTWATFDDDQRGRECYALVAPYVESRGYSAAMPESNNENLHQGGFRYR